MKAKIVLPLILLVSLISRLLFINISPASLFSDEVDAGYQAYIFNQCGTDYYGNKFPIHFHSFADFRTPAYIYAIALVQKITGPSDLSVRIPSIIFSTLSLFVFYLFLQKRFNQKIAIIGTFVLSLSPWFFHYGRTGFEVSGMMLFYLLGLYFFQVYLSENKPKHLALSLVFFVTTTYFYSTAKLFILITGLVLLYFYRRQLLSLPIKKIILILIPAFIIALPLIVSTLKGESGYRFNYISVFTDPTIPTQVDSLRLKVSNTLFPGQIGTSPSVFTKLMVNKYSLIFHNIIKNYLSVFSGEFLFISGDINLRHSFGQHGLFYPFEIFLLFYGLKLFSTKKNRDLLLLLLLSPLPFTLTRDSLGPHATRLIIILPFLIALISLSLYRLLKHSRKIFIIVIGLYLLFFTHFLHFYYFIYPQNSADQWHTNLKAAVISSQNHADKKIYYSSSPEPFIPFYLFYTGYRPTNCHIDQNLVHRNTPEFTGLSIGSDAYFGKIEWGNLKSDPQILYLVSENELPTVNQNHQVNIVDKITSDYQSSIDYYLISL